MDEETPHIHAVITPIVDGKLNSKVLFGDRQKLRDLQTDFANAVAPLGLKRGTEGSKADHTTLKDFYSNIKISQLKAEETIMASYQNAPLMELDAPPLIGREKWKAAQEAKLKNRMVTYLDSTVVPIVKSAAQKVINYDKMVKRIRQLEKENMEAKLAIREAFETKQFSRALIEKFLPEVADGLRKKEREMIKEETYRRLEEKIRAEKEAARQKADTAIITKAKDEETINGNEQPQTKTMDLKTEKNSFKQKGTEIRSEPRKTFRR